MKRLLVALVTAVALALTAAPAIAATGLKIQPLDYSAKLERGAKQRGVVDISNPTDESVRVKTSVKAVRQVDDQGQLEFYQDEQIAAGVTLDQDQLTIPAKGVYRLVFELDGTKLPAGDSVAAIFAQTVADKGSVGGSAQVGSLLFISNGTSAKRDATIAGLNVNWLQANGAVSGSYQLAKPADKSQSTGYRPEVTLELWPLHEPRTITGPLVFSGRQRTADFSLPTKAFGLYRLTVATDSGQQSRWLLLLPAWSALTAVGLLILALSWRYIWRRHRRRG